MPMPHDLTCTEAEERGYPERYAAGTLDDDAVSRFEEHFLVCAHCQQSVALASAVRRSAHAAHRRTRRRRYLSGALVLAAVVVVAVVRVQEPDSIRSLGRVETPPAYAGVAVRGASTPADTAFAAAMTAYDAGDYASATTRLRALANAGVTSPPVDFFLGASLLMTGRVRAAAAALARVIAAGDTPYADDARYYRALALLQDDRPDSAEALLNAAVRDAATPKAAARARDLLRRLEARREP